MLIGTNKGLVTIDIEKVLNQSNALNSSILLDKILINGKPHQIEDNKVKLNYNQNEIELFLRGSNLIDTSHNLYRYKIEGISDNWSKLQKDRSVSLIGLQPVKYRILIEGQNLVSGKSLLPLELFIIISPPFWETWWFLTLMILIFIALISLFVRYRVLKNQKIKNQQIILSQQLTEAKLEALRAQMNPHFTFNAINSIQNFIIDADTENALHYLSAFSKLIRQTLETATEKFVPLKLEIDFLTNYVQVQQMRFDKIKVDWNIADTINLYKTTIPPLIIQPYIENVFEHAFDDSMEEQHLTISFKNKSNQLICEVADNGMGNEEGSTSASHISKGLKITKARFELLNQELKTDEFQIEVFF